MRYHGNKNGGMHVRILLYVICISIFIVVIYIQKNNTKVILSKKLTEINLQEDEQNSLELKIINGNSLFQNGWYNSEKVDVRISTKEYIEPCVIKYGTRKKGDEEIPKDLKILEEESEVLTISQEGITEVVAYKETNEGIKLATKIIEVKIDRTSPTIDSLKCTLTKDNEINMIANGAQDGIEGSGIEEYVFFTNNTISPETAVRSKNNEIKINTKTTDFLGQVIIYDKAGNQTIVSTPDVTYSNSGLYQYAVYSAIVGDKANENVNLNLSNSNIVINTTLAWRNASYLACYRDMINGCAKLVTSLAKNINYAANDSMIRLSSYSRARSTISSKQ